MTEPWIHDLGITQDTDQCPCCRFLGSLVPYDNTLARRLHGVKEITIYQDIREYTKKSLTYSSDSLKAILGIFHHLSFSSPPVHHYWGIPMVRYEGNEDSTANFIFGLCWQLHGHNRSRLRRQAFPSWSWCGWENAPQGVIWGDHSHASIPHLMPIISIMSNGSLVELGPFHITLLKGGAQAFPQSSTTQVVPQDFQQTSQHTSLFISGLIATLDFGLQADFEAKESSLFYGRKGRVPRRKSGLGSRLVQTCVDSSKFGEYEMLAARTSTNKKMFFCSVPMPLITVSFALHNCLKRVTYGVEPGPSRELAI